MRGVCILTITILALVSPVFGQRFRPDGQPRPRGYPETPTKAYGATPRCVDPATNFEVDCEWYGFAHNDYPVTGARCLVTTREYMSNSSLIGYITPYEYYSLTTFVFNKTNNASYCFYGCFNMDATAATPPTGGALPPTQFAPPPPEEVSPPPAEVSAPPPVEIAIPPPAVDPAVPPTTMTPAPPTAGTPPATAGTPPALPPPGFFSLNAAGLVRPVMSILSLVVSGALLALNLLCF